MAIKTCLMMGGGGMAGGWIPDGSPRLKAGGS